MIPVRYSKAEVEEFTAKGYWTNEVFSDFWDRNAKEFPNKEALVDSKGTRLTWLQAKKQSDRLALAFIELGIPQDARVVVHLPNCVEGFIARVACEKAGIVSMTLMHTLRHKECQEIISLIEATTVIISRSYRNFDYYEMYQELKEQLPLLKNIIVIGEDVPKGVISFEDIVNDPLEEKYPVDYLTKRRFDPTHVGFLSTTTGTTGVPKVVEYSIAARLWSSKTHVRNWKLSPKDVLCAVAPAAGAAGGTPTYFCAPQAAAKIVLLYDYSAQNALEFFEKEKVTIPCVVPAQLAMIMQESLEKYDLSSIRAIRSAGGYLSPTLAEEVEQRFNGPIISTYGSQDTGSVTGININDSAEKRRTTVGKPLPGNQIRIVDDDGNVLPQGEVGQLYFRGAQNSGGYYRDPVKTFAEAYDSEGWASPGDLAKIDDDGFIMIVGRKKDIIIRGGQNIYPGEIENILMAHSKVSNVAIVAMPDKIMGEKACAFVIPNNKEGVLTFEEMVNFLNEKKLAKYKLPEHLEIVDTFPLASDSKVNKSRLREIITAKMEEEKIS
ncbi:AMP-binding protein [Desulfosporosinus lacus]|uniref:2,3-dihydroxybenzoate-AMP ligase n=1 Tax=Desulfosporosinus lacus DSM 15449 TaxID=1121420 RepID=A0A1M5Z0E6_9FIRM|nr:AMP-binding protein [Desulfosporosinus lacus]SHI17659.1 2,3-dihydroxybenzoate-AMP ligase [Desulfosporosinus lacus DSM 15449]